VVQIPFVSLVPFLWPRFRQPRQHGAAEFQPVLADEQAMEKMAKALGCPVEKLMVEPYPS